MFSLVSAAGRTDASRDAFSRISHSVCVAFRFVPVARLQAFVTKDLTVTNKKLGKQSGVRLHIWDTAGEEACVDELPLRLSVLVPFGVGHLVCGLSFAALGHGRARPAACRPAACRCPQ
jgi:hypothetical protein